MSAGGNSERHDADDLVVSEDALAFTYTEDDLAAEEAAIAEVAGVAPSALDSVEDSVLTYPGNASYPSVEDDAYPPSAAVDDLAALESEVPDCLAAAEEASSELEVELSANADAAEAEIDALATEMMVEPVVPVPEAVPEAVPGAEPGAPVAAAAVAAPAAPAPEKPSKRDEGPHLRRAPKSSEDRKASFTLSYRSRAVVAFAGVTLLTVAVSLLMVALIWGQFFNTYAAANIESLAEQTANRIATAYAKTLSLDGDTLIPAEEMANSSDELGVVVADAHGRAIYSSDSDESGHDNPSAATQIAIAPINHNGEAVGTVRVWVFGSNSLMSKVDREFQRDTYAALLYAGFISFIIALGIGVLFARGLVHPVNRVMKTARELSAGNLAARTGMRGTNELARLGETIDDMAESFERDRKLEKQLTSDVAHELRTPLMAIQATVEAMIDGVYDRDDEHLMLVDAEVQRLSKLVGAMLKLSRMEMRTQPMREEAVNLSELADEVVISHQAFIEESGLQIFLDAQPNVKTIGDADLIKQAIANLVSNAVRYTDEGGSITISVTRKERMAAVAVKDTGIGLSPEDEKMVFSRFWRADSGRAKESGGLGIGLTLVKEIVDQHYGRVGVKGQKGVGSVFTLYFPLYDEEKSIAQARLAVRAMERRQRFQS